MADDDLVEWYRSQATDSIDVEAEKRIAKHIPVFTEFSINKNGESTSNPFGNPVNDIDYITNT